MHKGRVVGPCHPSLCARAPKDVACVAHVRQCLCAMREHATDALNQAQTKAHKINIPPSAAGLSGSRETTEGRRGACGWCEPAGTQAGGRTGHAPTAASGSGRRFGAGIGGCDCRRRRMRSSAATDMHSATAAAAASEMPTTAPTFTPSSPPSSPASACARGTPEAVAGVLSPVFP